MKSRLLSWKELLLKKRTAFIVTALLFSASVNAQIVYTDIIPDTTLSNPGNYNLDLNNDGQNDFTFYGHLSPFTCGGGGCPRSVIDLTISPTSFSWVSDSASNLVGKLNLGDSINAASPLWTNALSQILFKKGATCVTSVSCASPPYGQAPTSLPSSGIWNNVIDKYVALKIQVSTNIYLGWARLDVGSIGWPVTIKDYAYNSFPNQPILAGQTVATGINENSFASSINIFPNPATTQLTIYNGKLKIENVTIYDLTGREAYNENHQTPNANSEISIDVSKFPAGVYAVQIKTADYRATKKLIIQK